jgi:hypothetical protein
VAETPATDPKAETPKAEVPKTDTSPPKEEKPKFFDPATETKGGSTEDRRQALDDALNRFGSSSSVVIVGDGISIGNVVGGNAFGGRAAEAAGPVLAEVGKRRITELELTFVEPPGYADLAEPLRRHRVLLLGTRARWGNTATAIRLLASSGPVHELTFAGRLIDLPIDRLPPGAGFILSAPGGRGLIGLQPTSLTELTERLEKADCRIVVITDADRDSEHGGRPVWRRLPGPPEAYELVVRHLERGLGSRDAAVEMLEQGGLAGGLKDTAPDAFDVQRLIELAADLAEVSRGNGTLEDAGARFAARAERAVEEWVDGLDDPVRAMVLALAVLDGMSFDAVSRAAKWIGDHWAAQEQARLAGTSRRIPRSERLKQARAQLSEEPRNTRYGPAVLEVASFVDSNYPQRILRHFWNEHDYDRELLLEWLKEVADDVEFTVCIQAATAIGYLATFAFDTVRREVITPWATKGNGEERELAVAALARTARDPATVGRTVELVADWAGRPGETHKMAAARALGDSVGAVVSKGLDETLAKLAKGADGYLSLALGDSIGELLAAAELPRQRELLSLLDTWSGEGRNERQTAGVFAFLQMALRLSKQDGDQGWPMMLWLAEHDRESAELIARLWSRALIAPDTDDGVRAVLRTWAQWAEQNPEFRPAFVRLFAAVPRSRRQADLLTKLAEELRTGKPPSPDTARNLIDALMKGL